MTSTRFLSVLATLLLLGLTAAYGQTKRIDVKFRTGTSSATSSNSVTGYGTADFYVKANSGQEMTAKLTSTNKFLYFLVIKDPALPEAIADDARDTTEWTGTLSSDGTYIVRVFLVRAEARRNKRPVKFTLRIGVK